MSHPATVASFMSRPQQSPAPEQLSGWGLARGEARRLVIGPGPRWLKVEDGTVWLTVTATDGTVSDDQWLHAGEAVWLASGAELVLEGRGDARFALLVPPQACRGIAEPAPLAARLGALARRWRAATQWSRRPTAIGPYTVA